MACVSMNIHIDLIAGQLEFSQFVPNLYLHLSTFLELFLMYSLTLPSAL